MDNKDSAVYFRYMDMLWQAGLARLTLGISPAGASGHYFSWVSHLAQAPGKIAELMTYPFLHTYDFTHRMTWDRSESCAADLYVSPDRWLAEAKREEGSWWKSWHDWLQQYSTGKKIPPLPFKKTLGSAPGTYILQK